MSWRPTREYSMRQIIDMAHAVEDAGGRSVFRGGPSAASREEIIRAYNRYFPERKGAPPSEYERTLSRYLRIGSRS